MTVQHLKTVIRLENIKCCVWIVRKFAGLVSLESGFKSTYEPWKTVEKIEILPPISWITSKIHYNRSRHEPWNKVVKIDCRAQIRHSLHWLVTQHQTTGEKYGAETMHQRQKLHRDWKVYVQIRWILGKTVFYLQRWGQSQRTFVCDSWKPRSLV